MNDRIDSLLRNPAALLLVVVMALMSIGLVMVYSASGARAGLETKRIAASAGNSTIILMSDAPVVKAQVWKTC